MSGARAERDYDCIVIGAGHNGLVCAAYLARAGRSVLVLEAATEVGGAAVTREFAPGFRVSAGAHLLRSMSREIIADLSLERHGLTWAAEDLPAFALASGEAMRLDADGIGAHSARDAEAYVQLRARLERFARALQGLITRVPPRLGTHDRADQLALLRLGWQIRRLGRRDLRELLRVAGMCVYDLMQENFTSLLLQGALGFDAVLGANMGPRSPGSVFALLYQLTAAAIAGRRAPAQPRGGLGALSNALAQAARNAGAQIRTSEAVRAIHVEADRAAGVILASGERIRAGCVVSNADPKTTFLGLLGSEHLDAGFVRRVRHLRTAGLAAKLHLALDRLPAFRGLEPGAHGARLLIAPSLDYLERAYDHSKYGEFSAEPALEITIPSLHDAQLAPPGAHVLSAIVQYVPYALKGGWHAAARERLTELIIGRIEAHAPGLRQSIRAVELLIPPDIEAQFRIQGGHWHHADLALDQFLFVRPVPGAAQYATPLPGLYLCGAGCHPGGGVMGTAGRNAASRVLSQAA